MLFTWIECSLKIWILLVTEAWFHTISSTFSLLFCQLLGWILVHIWRLNPPIRKGKAESKERSDLICRCYWIFTQSIGCLFWHNQCLTLRFTLQVTSFLLLGTKRHLLVKVLHIYQIGLFKLNLLCWCFCSFWIIFVTFNASLLMIFQVKGSLLS